MSFLPILTHFPLWWYQSVPAWWWRLLRRLFTYLNNRLAVTLMAHFWLVPVWQDTTIIGRTLSFIFRTTRVIIGSLIITLVTIALTLWLLAWLVLPPLLLTLAPFSLIFFLSAWIIDILRLTLRQTFDPTQVLLKQTNHNLSTLISLLQENHQVRLLLELIEQPQIPNKLPNVNVDQLVAQAQQLNLDQPLHPTHLFLALLQQLKFHPEEARAAYDWVFQKYHWSRVPWIWQPDYPLRPIGGVNRAWIGIITPTLDSVSTDLTKLAAKAKVPHLIGREKYVTQIVRTLSGTGSENVLIVGQAGSGKSTLVESFANEIIAGTQYPKLRFKRLIELDIAALTAGSHTHLRQKLVTVIAEIQAAGNIILFIDEVHNLFAAEQNPTASVVLNAFQPYLDAGAFQFIATTTPEAFKQYLEPNTSFTRTFQKINLAPASPEDTLNVLKWRAYQLERHFGLQLTYKSLQTAVQLADRYLHNRVMPDSAIHLLTETVEKNQTKPRITSGDVENMATELTQIPVRSPDSQQEKQLLLNLEKRLHTHVIGQHEAITQVADALRRARAGLTDAHRLIGSFLFVGGTGVGKTETAKALAQVYFGSPTALVRLDMSEYQTLDSINRLIGPPPGEPGYQLGGQLTEAVRRRAIGGRRRVSEGWLFRFRPIG